MTVDVEDYFHASAFDRVVSRTSWPERESRVAANTHRLLELFDSAPGQGHVLRARLGGATLSRIGAGDRQPGA